MDELNSNETLIQQIIYTTMLKVRKDSQTLWWVLSPHTKYGSIHVIQLTHKGKLDPWLFVLEMLVNLVNCMPAIFKPHLGGKETGNIVWGLPTPLPIKFLASEGRTLTTTSDLKHLSSLLSLSQIHTNAYTRSTRFTKCAMINLWKLLKGIPRLCLYSAKFEKSKRERIMWGSIIKESDNFWKMFRNQRARRMWYRVPRWLSCISPSQPTAHLPIGQLPSAT